MGGRQAAGDEAASAELVGAARRVETMVPGLGKIVETGLLSQVPGLGERARDVIRLALAEAGVDYATAIRWLVDDALRRAPVPQE